MRVEKVPMRIAICKRAPPGVVIGISSTTSLSSVTQKDGKPFHTPSKF